jgi:hypothetical protein
MARLEFVPPHRAERAAAADALADAIETVADEDFPFDKIRNSDGTGLEFEILDRLQILGWKLVPVEIPRQRLLDARHVLPCRRVRYRVQRACDPYRHQWRGMNRNYCDVVEGPEGVWR